MGVGKLVGLGSPSLGPWICMHAGKKRGTVHIDPDAHGEYGSSSGIVEEQQSKLDN